MNAWIVALGMGALLGWLLLAWVQDPNRRRAYGLAPAGWPVVLGEYLCALVALYGLIQTALDVALV